MSAGECLLGAFAVIGHTCASDVELLCATVRFGTRGTSALPSLVVVKLADSPRIASRGDLMSEEIHVGRQGTARVAEPPLRTRRGGTAAGSASKRDSQEVTPSSMSRARFASHFRQIIGLTPGDHITSCRIARSQELPRQGLPLKLIAPEVGYGSASAFARASSRLTGTAPGAWRSREIPDTGARQRLWETDYTNIIRRAVADWPGRWYGARATQEISIRTRHAANVALAPERPSPSSSTRREHLRSSLPGTARLLHRRRADLIGDDLIGAYVALDWLEWNGGALRLTIVGENICAASQAADAS